MWKVSRTNSDKKSINWIIQLIQYVCHFLVQEERENDSKLCRPCRSCKRNSKNSYQLSLIEINLWKQFSSIFSRVNDSNLGGRGTEPILCYGRHSKDKVMCFYLVYCICSPFCLSFPLTKSFCHRIKSLQQQTK